jgi:sulfur carrier protein ThiS adenylyltransferase
MSGDERFERAFKSRNVPGASARLEAAVVGIMGAGGLGSNVAHALVRAGVGRIIIADPDRVEASNLNRQLFFRDQVGVLKVEALTATLERIAPFTRITALARSITPGNIMDVYREADLLVEALDLAASKASLIESWLMKTSKPIVAASGLAGIGRTERIRVRRMGRLVVCGDGESEMAEGLCSARVALVAGMQANIALELLLL